MNAKMWQIYFFILETYEPFVFYMFFHDKSNTVQQKNKITVKTRTFKILSTNWETVKKLQSRFPKGQISV
jgi:hypothetical protein